MTVQSYTGEKSASQTKPLLNKTRENTQRTLLCREEGSWERRWGCVQDKETKQVHCLQGSAIHYEQEKDIALHAPETPCCQTSGFHAGTTVSAQTFLLRVRVASSTLKNTVDKAFSRKKTSEGAQPGLSGNRTTVQQNNRIFGDFHISDNFLFFVLLFLCWKRKKYSVKV